MENWGLSKYTETKIQTACSHLKLIFLKIIKRGLKLVSLPHFPHNFWRKIFLLLYSINWPNFIVWLSLPCEILDNMCIATVCKPDCDVMNSEAYFTSLIKPFFLHDQKVVTKTKISWEQKELLRWNKKQFFNMLKELLNNTIFFGRWESEFK